VCCVAVGGPKSGTLFAGSWDTTIWSWDLASRAPWRKYVGHTDFVKAVVCAKVGGKDLLISGGADKKIIVWDIASGARLHTLQDSAVNMLGVQDLVVDPASSSPDEVSLISASSDPHIRRWRIRLDGWEQVVETLPDAPSTDRRTLLEHETTVYKLVLDHDSDEVDLWTSSGDGTAKCLSRLKNFTCEDTFHHGDHVRAVAITDQWVITAGRDEDVKFWDRASGKLYCSLAGHYDEVTDLVVLRGPSGSSQRVCSVSIDGTVRTWPFGKAGLDAAVKEQEKPALEEEKEKIGANDLLSAEEEAELAALMEDDDE
jgi:WD40 repeat protein